MATDPWPEPFRPADPYEVRCPRCGARPGLFCEKQNGGATNTHKARRMKAARTPHNERTTS